MLCVCECVYESVCVCIFTPDLHGVIISVQNIHERIHCFQHQGKSKFASYVSESYVYETRINT